MQSEHQQTGDGSAGGQRVPLRQHQQADEAEYDDEKVHVAKVRVPDELLQFFHGVLPC